MPVFFYIDPDYVNDPFLENTDEITLSYTFFESKYDVKYWISKLSWTSFFILHFSGLALLFPPIIPRSEVLP